MSGSASGISAHCNRKPNCPTVVASLKCVDPGRDERIQHPMKTKPDSMRLPLGVQLARALSRAFSAAPSASAAALGLVFLYPTGASAQVVVTQNTVGTFNWECPPGVFSVQVECWGGGGGGGAATNTIASGSPGINAGGGGGAGGAYARTANVPVTPGTTYTLTVPPAALGAPAGSAEGVLGETGGTVTFAGDSSTEVTAVGGPGGATKVITSGGSATGAGGQGTTTGCVGDVIFAGGSSNAGGGTCGGGGGGAGDSNNGGNTSNQVGGAGGLAGGGAGGTGPTGSNNGNAVGAPGIAGGGGSGGRVQRGQAVTSRKGGDGAIGQIILTYTPPSTGKLVVTTVPGNAAAGTDFSVTVQAQDSGGSPFNVTQDTSISLAASGTGTLSGNTAIIPNGQNSLTLNSVQYTKAEAITFTASRTSGDQLDTSVASSPITVDAAAASRIVFTTQPSASTPLDTPFATQPVVQIQDTFGNLVATGGDATANVSLALTTGTGTLGGTTSINAVDGVADFVGQGLNINQGGTDKVLTATATIGAGIVTATTSPFAITATALTWSATPATFDWNTTDSNWSGGPGVYTDPGTSAVTFDDNGDASSPINVVGILQPASVTVNGDTNNYTFSGAGDVSGTTGITKNGSSILTVSNANTYSGETTVNAGTMVMANPAALGDGTGLIRFPGSSTGTLLIATNGTDTPYNLGSNSGTADLVNNIWTTDFTIASGVATPGAGINHTMGNVTLALARMNIVAGPNVSGGDPKITFGSMSVISASANPPALINPTTASVSIGNVTTLNNTAKTLILGGTSTGNEITGDIIPGPGTLAVTKTDTSTWTLSGANTYTGVTTVNNGTLLNGSATTFANTGNLDVDGTGNLDLNGFDASFTNLTDDGNAGTITNGAVGSAKITLTNVLDDDDHLKSALFTGNLAISIANSNSSTSLAGLRTDNSFTGGIILRDGTGLAVGSPGTRLRIFTDITTTPGTPFGSGPITIGEANTDKAGIMMDTVSNAISNAIVFNTALGTDVIGMRIQGPEMTLAGQITANLADATFASGSASTGTVTLTGKVTGPSGLALTPPANSTTSAVTVTLNNAATDNDYAGDTTISQVASSAYRIVLGAANQIPNGAGKGNVVNDGTLDLNGFSETINGLSGAGVVQANGGILTVGDNDASSTFDGILQDKVGSLALTKIGNGTLTLAGANTYTGDTTVSGGTLALTGASIEDTAKLVINGGIVDVSGNEVVGALDLGSGPLADGIYGSSSSSAPPANQDDIRFSGTGTVEVITPPASGFSIWIAGTFANGTVINQGPDDDDDKDGISNLLEYAVAGFDPTVGNGSIGTLVGKTLTVSKRQPLASDITYAIEQSTDLGVSDPWEAVTPTVNDGSTISHTLPGGPAKDFMRLKVTQP